MARRIKGLDAEERRAQRRGQLLDAALELFAADVKKVTAALGTEYKVVALGIDQPIEWVRAGMLEVTIFVPYRYDVLPANVTSYLRTSE